MSFSGDRCSTLWPRRLVVVRETSYEESPVKTIFEEHAGSGIWIGNQAPPDFSVIPTKDAYKLLGTEHALIILDARDGLDPNALGIAAGCIPGSGTLVLWLPDHSADRFSTSPFHQRLFRFLNTSQIQEHTEIRLNRKESRLENHVTSSLRTTVHATTEPITQDQEQAVQAVEHVLSGQRKKPVLLIADRGRGKSAALGIAAARILQQKECQILITGRSRNSVDVVFRHATGILHQASENLQWIDFNSLLAKKPSADLLLVDEAAGIPLDRLAMLLNYYSRIALATTVHGYEGSGRGFILRFQELLERCCRGWHLVRLETPIRWGPGDPLEIQINQLLLLDTTVPELPRKIDEKWSFVDTISGKELAHDEEELRTIFSLLVTAHYRTRPSDLRHLLDHEGLLIYRLRINQSGKTCTIGVLLAIRELAPDPTLQQSIASGQRRPGSHVLAEIVSGKLGIHSALTVNMIRIQRIVIHPQLQRRGLGKRLLNQFCHHQSVSFSLIGTQFALSAGLINFWRSCGFVPVSVGAKASRYAGTASGLFLQPLSPIGELVLSEAATQFNRQFAASLLRTHRELNGEIVYALLNKNDIFAERPNGDDFKNVAGFCFANKPEETIPASLSRMILWGLSVGKLSDAQFCIERVLQARSWTDCNSLNGQEGQADGTSRLRQSCADLLKLETTNVAEGCAYKFKQHPDWYQNTDTYGK